MFEHRGPHVFQRMGTMVESRRILTLRSSSARQAGLPRILTASEKRKLAGQVFRDGVLDHIDLSSADLRNALFENTTLAGSDFTRADLRGARFLRCDVRGARFGGARFRRNRFDASWFTGAIGLSRVRRAYIERRGGSFLRLVHELPSPETPSGGRRPCRTRLRLVYRADSR